MANGSGHLGWPLRIVPNLMWRAVRALDEETHHVIDASGSRALLRSTEHRSPSGEILAVLLADALVQSADEARESLAVEAVRGLVPDEARVLATLGTLGWAAAVDVDAGRAGELLGQTLLGRKAGLSLPLSAPFYLRRLQDRGLVDRTDAKVDKGEEYEILLAEPAVLAALRAGRRGARSARVDRFGIELSGLGWSILRAAREPGGER